MPEVMIRDVVLWTKHIHGDASLRAHLSQLSGEKEIDLVVDGVRGHWRKMADGKDGRPTSGLTPQGRMQNFWRELYASKRGASVSISLPPTDGADSALARPSPPRTPHRANVGAVQRTQEAVAAAREAILTAVGWSSEGRTFTRDELYDR